jgi:hypothetical protein
MFTPSTGAAGRSPMIPGSRLHSDLDQGMEPVVADLVHHHHGVACAWRGERAR